MSARSRSAPWWGSRRSLPWDFHRFIAQEADRVGYIGVVGVDYRGTVHGQVVISGNLLVQAPRFNRVLYGIPDGPRAPWWRRLWWRFVAWLGW